MADEKKYKTIHLNVSKVRESVVDQLTKLSEKLDGCRPSDLVWFAIETMIANPPEAAPPASKSSTGSSPGFWNSTISKEGEAVGITITEVAKRAEGEGRTFFRFSVKDDMAVTEANRERALKQARKAAAYDADLMGLNVKSIRETING